METKVLQRILAYIKQKNGDGSNEIEAENELDDE